MSATAPGPQSSPSPKLPFRRRLKIGVLAGLVVGVLLFSIIYLAVGLSASDTLLISAILAVFVLLIGLGFHTAATVYLAVMEVFFSVLAAMGAALAAIFSIFG